MNINQKSSILQWFYIECSQKSKNSFFSVQLVASQSNTIAIYFQLKLAVSIKVLLRYWLCKLRAMEFNQRLINFVRYSFA